MDTKSLWNGIEGIVLDAVGTLIEPEPPVAQVYLDAAGRQGVSLRKEDVRARFGRHFRDGEADGSLGPMLTDEPLERRRWRRIVGRVLPEVREPERAFAELWDHFARPDAWRCFEDVAAALAAFDQAGLRIAIASNFDARLRRVVAGLPELAPLGQALVISSEVGCRKPHPRFYQAVCKRLGLAPARVLFVGDDPENDVAGPIRAGLRGVLLDRAGARVVPGALAELRTLRPPRFANGKADFSRPEPPFAS